MSRNLDELINKNSTTWKMVCDWISSANNIVEVLSNERSEGEDALLKLQVTTNSTIGSIALESGGLLIDNGWLRILGSGNKTICGSLITWNCLNGSKIIYPLNGGLIVAYDILGGFFAINSGGLGDNFKNVYYFAPDILEWEDTGKGYTDFIYWILSGDLNLFYKTFRWVGWMEDVKNLTGEQGIQVYPYLWTQQGKDISKCQKEPIPILELWGLHNEFLRQMKN